MALVRIGLVGEALLFQDVELAADVFDGCAQGFDDLGVVDGAGGVDTVALIEQ